MGARTKLAFMLFTPVVLLMNALTLGQAQDTKQWDLLVYNGITIQRQSCL